nr:hypothetical protein [Tanacetum cinerariifolium]
VVLLKVWGCEALVKRDTLTKPDKLEPKAIKCIFVGYAKETMGYSFYYPPENKYSNASKCKNLSWKMFCHEDLGEAAYILGIKIYRDRSNKSQGASTPAEMKHMQNVPYALAVGSIIGDLKQELRVSCYTDGGYLTDADDLKSQTRYVLVLNGGAVDWKSAKQSIFATSSVEAEYIAAFDAFKEVV